MVAAGKTESIKPVAGTFSTLIEVPTLTRQLGRHDIIEATDISMKAVPERHLRKETVTDAKALIGQSPRAIISANRPIRASEVNAPIVVKKGDTVQMTFTNAYMSIRTSGIALEDGAKGQMIRVKNEKSEKAVSGHVEAAGRVEMNAGSAL
jgi:flagella basal body P-ring formation protein FlgA